ncbi:hypothetical protein F7725_019958, partial [Dissostichus mawsoni]
MTQNKSSLCLVPGKKFHVSVAGRTNGAHQTYVNDLKGLGQIEVISPEQSDYLVLFCPIASRVGTDIGEAMDKNLRRLVENPDVIVTVDVLFHESKMLICNRNDMAWSKVEGVLVSHFWTWFFYICLWYKAKKMTQNKSSLCLVPGKKFHVSVAGCTNGAHQTYVNDLKGLGQIEVISPEQSDYLVLFCPIASRVGTDIGEAMDKISDHFVPESRRLVENPDVIVTVDVLFHESKMLICNHNDMAWSKRHVPQKVKEQSTCQSQARQAISLFSKYSSFKAAAYLPWGYSAGYTNLRNMDDQGQRKVPGKKFHVSVAGCTNGAHQTYVNDLKGLGQIEVISPEQSDYLVLFCPIASRVGTDIGEAMNKISDHFVPESRRLVENPDVIVTVDVLFHESKMLICNHNDMAWLRSGGSCAVTREHVPQKVKEQSNMPESGQTSYQSVQNSMSPWQDAPTVLIRPMLITSKGWVQIEVISPEQSDYLVLFCPIASRQETRENPDVIVTVDVLFHKSKMLICNHNDMAWSKVEGVLVVSPGK